MTDSVQPAADNIQAKKPSTFHGKPVLVQCEKFRCLAQQDANGKWISIFGGKELTTFISVFDAQES